MHVLYPLCFFHEVKGVGVGKGKLSRNCKYLNSGLKLNEEAMFKTHNFLSCIHFKGVLSEYDCDCPPGCFLNCNYLR